MERDVGTSDIFRREQRKERCTFCRSLNACPAALLAVDQAEDTDDPHAGLARRFHRGDGGAASGTDVVDNNDGGASGKKTLDQATGAMRLLGFPDEKSVNEVNARIRWPKAL